MDRSARPLKYIPQAVGLLTLVVGALVLVGWASGNTLLKSLSPAWPAMTANTALCFVLIGLSLLALRRDPSRAASMFGRACILFCGLLGLLTLCEYLFAWNPGIDQWLFPAGASVAGASHPGRMAPETALCFVLLALGLLGSRHVERSMVRFGMSSILAALVVALAFSSLFAHCSHLPVPFGFWGLPLMAAHTALLFVLLGGTIFCIVWPPDLSLWSLAGRTASGLAIWTLLVIAALAWGLHQQGHDALDESAAAARANISKDLAFRRWATSHGGVYVVPTERTPPNPYLKVAERDVVTTTGKVLTLMNPAYMMRDMQQNFTDEFGTKSRISSLKPLNPMNGPDEWQAKALASFERGATELFEVQYLEGKPYLRLMLPLFAERGCLKCHAQQGYKEGEVRGGLSTSVPLTPFLLRTWESQTAQAFSLLAIWLAGVAALSLFYWREFHLEEKREKLEFQLRQSQKMEAIGTLAGGIAHDFNNILSIIFGYAELAIVEADQESRRQHLKELVKGAERARDLVRQILAFSRKAEQQQYPLQISTIIKEALKMLRASLPTTIEIRQHIASEGRVLADPTQIHQVIMNLCTNAFHAMRESGGVLAVSLEDVRISAEDRGYPGLAPGNYLKMEVSDTGGGIAPEIREKIFEPYFTTKEHGEGTGLGLAVVHGIVKSHHGHVAVYSEPGQGTSFRVYLPQTDVLPEEKALAVGVSPQQGGGERILVVDDEEQIRKMLGMMLTRNGYQVESVANGAEALAEFAGNPACYDLVITDMTMPGITGTHLAQQLLALRPELPIILCTGQSELINRDKALALGVREYLGKPILQEELLATVRQALRKEGGGPGGV